MTPGPGQSSTPRSPRESGAPPRWLALAGVLLAGTSLGLVGGLLLRPGPTAEPQGALHPGAASSPSPAGHPSRVQPWPESAPNARAAPAAEITLTAIIDGSDRFVFAGENLWNEHLHWQGPREVMFNGKPWTDLATAPSEWAELARDLDLSQARIVTREGRDIIALEPTPDGFDLYFADTQMGSGKYTVTVSIPRRPPTNVPARPVTSPAPAPARKPSAAWSSDRATGRG